MPLNLQFGRSYLNRIQKTYLMDKYNRTPADSTLLDHLELLTRAGLIDTHHPRSDQEYTFASTLVFEAVRGSLVKQDRRLLHFAIAETLEECYPERLEDFAPILADHFHHAGEDRRAMLYYTMSGNLALQRYANAEAARFFSNSLVIARSVFRQGSESEQAGFLKALGELYHKRGQALWWSGIYSQAVENYKDEWKISRATRGMKPWNLVA